METLAPHHPSRYPQLPSSLEEGSHHLSSFGRFPSSREEGTEGWCGALLAAAKAEGRPGGAPLPAISGGRAFEDLKRLVAFGPRPAGSKNLAQARQWLEGRLQEAGCPVEEDGFMASTPVGDLPMTNLLVKLAGKSPKIILLAGHYDTARTAEPPFVGANDGGSSAALLVEFGRALCKRKNSATVWLVFFDGEEAQQHWSDSDSLYGSRHFVAKLTASGELSRIEAMILVDMVGDARLNLERDGNSTPWLTDLVFAAARRLGYEKYFPGKPTAYVDDHIPFVDAGVAAVDLLDLDYGPGNSYWHTPRDTPDKCSPASLTIVGRVVLAAVEDLEKNPH